MEDKSRCDEICSGGDCCAAAQRNTRFLPSYRLLRSERGDNLLKTWITAQRIPAYFAVRQPRVTDCVLILIAEQSKAGLRNTSRTNFSYCVNDDFGFPLFAAPITLIMAAFPRRVFGKRDRSAKGPIWDRT